MCEVLNPDGTPHESNGRATIDDDDDDFGFGFEQEYTLIDLETELPLGFPKGGYLVPRVLITLQLVHEILKVVSLLMNICIFVWKLDSMWKVSMQRS